MQIGRLIGSPCEVDLPSAYSAGITAVPTIIIHVVHVTARYHNFDSCRVRTIAEPKVETGDVGAVGTLWSRTCASLKRQTRMPSRHLSKQTNMVLKPAHESPKKRTSSSLERHRVPAAAALGVTGRGREHL